MKISKIVLILIFALLLVSCKDAEGSSFDFTLRYNVKGSNMVSSFNDTLIIDTVEGPKTIEFILSNEDREKIKDKFLELEIMNEDYTFLKNEHLKVKPYEENELIVEIDKEEFRIEWTTNNIPPFRINVTSGSTEAVEGYEEDFEKFKRLLELKNFIINIVEESEEFKMLPPQRGYQ